MLRHHTDLQLFNLTALCYRVTVTGYVQ